MRSRDFCFWLMGYLEVTEAANKSVNPKELTSDQVEVIQRHLNLVFKHEIDSSFEDSAELNKIHHGNRPELVRC